MIKELVVHHSKIGPPMLRWPVLRPCQQARLAMGAKDVEYAMSPRLKPLNVLIVAEQKLASRV
jgi:hypothetical protein